MSRTCVDQYENLAKRLGNESDQAWVARCRPTRSSSRATLLACSAEMPPNDCLDRSYLVQDHRMQQRLSHTRKHEVFRFTSARQQSFTRATMANTDKLAMGLDDIIRTNRTANRRGGKPGFRGRGGAGVGRGAGQSNGFRTRGGGGGLVTTFAQPARASLIDLPLAAFVQSTSGPLETRPVRRQHGRSARRTAQHRCEQHDQITHLQS